MKIVIKTIVSGNYRSIMDKFDRQLFEALAPPFPPMEIIDFTGSRKGDRVHIQFKFPFRAIWISDITEDGADEQKAWFVDEGATLPFPLTYWKHRHIVRKISENTSEIIDDISFDVCRGWLSFLFYPVLYAGFYQRKKIYKKYFQR